MADRSLARLNWPRIHIVLRLIDHTCTKKDSRTMLLAMMHHLFHIICRSRGFMQKTPRLLLKVEHSLPLKILSILPVMFGQSSSTNSIRVSVFSPKKKSRSII